MSDPEPVVLPEEIVMDGPRKMCAVIVVYMVVVDGTMEEMVSLSEVIGGEISIVIWGNRGERRGRGRQEGRDRGWQCSVRRDGIGVVRG